MLNNDRSNDSETDREQPEDPERKEAVEGGVPFIETLDAQTRAELDEVLERSVMLARDVIAALYRR